MTEHTIPEGEWGGLYAATKRHYERRGRERDQRVAELGNLPIEQMTRRQLAEKVGVHPTTVSKYLRILGRDPRTDGDAFTGVERSLQRRAETQKSDRESRLQHMRGRAHERTVSEWSEYLGISENSVYDYCRELKENPAGKVRPIQEHSGAASVASLRREARLELLRSLDIESLIYNDIHYELRRQGLDVTYKQLRLDVRGLGRKPKVPSHKERADKRWHGHDNKKHKAHLIGRLAEEPEAEMMARYSKQALWNVEAATQFRADMGYQDQTSIRVRGEL